MLTKDIFEINSSEDFKRIALKVFEHQYHHTAIYRQFCDLLKVVPTSITEINHIPFLPIQFFKSHRVISEGLSATAIFESSGTTGSLRSKHHVSNLDLYTKSFTKGFEHFYGEPSEYVILALLPSYLDRSGSSLVYMVNELIKQTHNSSSGFYLNNSEE